MKDDFSYFVFSWFLSKIPKRIVTWCLIRALAEWEPEHTWEDRGNVAFWAVLEFWVRRTRTMEVLREWKRSGLNDVPERTYRRIPDSAVTWPIGDVSWTGKGEDE